jgi:thymidylate synthase (FAD)
MHQDYCEDYVGDRIDKAPSEDKAGALVVKSLLEGNRGHYGCLEYPQITFATGYFPHSVMQQARTHRVGTTFDVQSMRYTGHRLVEAFYNKSDIEDLFYLRPIGNYRDRSGKNYNYSEQMRTEDLKYLECCLTYYARSIELGFSEEHARGTLPFDFRQHFVVGFNARSLMHFLDLRAKKDAQLEIQWLCELMFPHFEVWMPDVAAWYKKNRYGKALLAP